MNESLRVLVGELTTSYTAPTVRTPNQARHAKDRAKRPTRVIRDAWGHPSLLNRLETMLTPGREGSSGRRGGKVSGSPSPGRKPVESLLWEIKGGARAFERQLGRLTAVHVRRRNLSDRQAWLALRNLPNLIDSGLLLPCSDPAGCSSDDVKARRRAESECALHAARTAERKIRSWHGRALKLIGVEDMPRVPLPCPECGTSALRQRLDDRSVVCLRCGADWKEAALHFLGLASERYGEQETA